MAGFLISMTLLSLGVIFSITGLVIDGPSTFTALGGSCSGLGVLVMILADRYRTDL